MVAPPLTRRMTIDEFERMIALYANTDRSFELIDGEMVEKMPTLKHGKLALRLGSRLLAFAEAAKLGHVGVEVRHQLPDDPHNSRLPDISYVSQERLAEAVDETVEFMPDLAVEIKSPKDSPTKMRLKANYYVDNGSRLVWLVFPDARIIEVYTADGDLRILNDGDLLDGAYVLPGLTMRVRELFEV